MAFITYYRVSTARQGASGLGLEAQRAACEAHSRQTQQPIAGEYVEVESGRRNDRPELAKALETAKLTGATLLIAKLDRLSRNAAFLLTLRDSGVKFEAADMPHANSLTVGILALVAQHEAEAISARTKAALAAAKARGQRLGNPNGTAAIRRAGKGNSAAMAAVRAKADQHASSLRATLGELEEAGVTSLAGVANALNNRGILTPRGGRWHASSVANLRSRLEAMTV